MNYYRTNYEILKAEGNSWEQMAEKLLLLASARKKVTRLVFFTDCKSNEEYLSQRAFLEQWVYRNYVTPHPVVSLISQKPLVGELVLEIHSLDAKEDVNVQIEEKFTDNSISYLLITAEGYKEIVAGGLCADDLSLSIYNQSEQAFKQIEDILNAEGMNFGDIVRQWNYIEDITMMAEGNQHYQEFNDIRSRFYASSDWPHGYPAATGIGAQYGGIQIDFNAISGNVNLMPLDNDWQQAAHVYSDDVLIGPQTAEEKETPKFERGKMISDGKQRMIYVSGTAAIRGEESIGGDVFIQTEITLENILHVVDPLTEKEALYEKINQPALLRVYLKNDGDMQTAKDVLDKHYPSVPTVYLKADVCREELLIEIEAIAYT